MELSRGIISAPLPQPTLRTAPGPRLGRRLPFGAFSPPQPLSDVREHGCCVSRALRPRQEWVEGWVRSNDTLVRSLPILVGGASLIAVLLNRAVSGIAAVADASSSQSRADILTLALSVTDILAGLVWLSIRPKSISPVVPRGVECKRVGPGVSSSALHELLWTWDSLTTATCCKSLVVVYGGNCILQIGVAAGSPEDGNALTVDTQKFIQGSLYKSAMESKKQSYLANLALYPGRSELPFLPANTQALILQPIGDKGIAVVGGDTIRGFTSIDQAWIAMMADKLDATLSKSYNP
ncbi:hypothetical protein SEVIR_7G297800v4 [Setaria viridis]|uniref:Protein COFACTOR ASSEMBLY OF COMPLEX C SUBUNIT B CCB4, chloroplastic n=1 Tax=Setaria viridis TaxID=4556 RepID=A0A4U6U212_SETVI|nr:protein COFACTOR ASSEMBLY OF COMPLEX C SUBUNIT B CCB4, chloroplastic-like [Setaria viridis]TKW07319.1 hypothetical protein SEVIR_7G297800v2 [Setaria viridis]